MIDGRRQDYGINNAIQEARICANAPCTEQQHDLAITTAAMAAETELRQ